MHKVFDDKDLKKAIEKLEGWELKDGKLNAQIEFENFKEAFTIMTRIAFEAELLAHHPEWTNVYNQLDISLTTHDAGGITEKDITLAKRINEIIGW
jgi:4a-hydroxytetrahydrobiopterin dehydratase